MMDASFGWKENNKSDDDEDSEESGWTTYFDDFFANKKQEEQYYYSGGRINTNDNYFVYDAASFEDVDHKKLSKSSGQLIMPSTSTLTKLSSKTTVLDMKKRNKEIFYEDSLEDTASSPVNSPKMIMQVERGIPNHLRLDGQSVEKTTGMLLMKGQKSDCTEGLNT